MDEESIFLQAIEFESAEARTEFLDQACQDNDELRHSVEILLLHHRVVGDFLETPPSIVASENTTLITDQDVLAAPFSKGDTVRYIGDYEIIQEIARGGMGIVYQARQIHLNRDVALKTILAGQFASDADVRRFQTEAEAAANLDHPSIVPIYEVGEFEGHHYFSMKLIDGSDLSNCSAQFTDDIDKTARLMISIAQAVQHAHQRGVLHRDLKPNNILIDSTGAPHITDFGLAKRTEGGESLTNTSAIMGTPSYISPEQARGEKSLSTATDVYGLGAILFHLLTGRPPFQGNSPPEILLGVLNEEPPSPAAVNPKVSRDINTICLKCLEKESERRYQSAAELADDLQRWLNHEPILARRISPVRRAQKWLRRHPAVTSMLVMTLVAMLGITWQWRRAEAERERSEYQLYVNHIALAQHEWLAGNMEYGNRNLSQCQPEHRQWEWHFMKRLCQPLLRHATLSFGKNIKGNRPTAIAFSPDGQHLITARGRMARIEDVSSGVEIVVIETADPILFVTYSLNGDFIVTVTRNETKRRGETWNTVTVWETDQKRYSLSGHSGSDGGIVFAPDGKRIIMPDSNQSIIIWDPQTDDVETFLEINGRCFGIALNPQGDRLAAVFKDGIKIWNLETAEEVCSIKDHAVNSLVAPTFSPEGDRLATQIGLWDAATGEKLCRWSDDIDRSGRPAFSLDGKYVVTAGHNRKMYVQDALTGEIVRRYLRTQIGLGAQLAINSNGQCIATVGEDIVKQERINRVCLWNGAVAQPETTLPSHQQPTTATSFSPDGRYMAAVSRRQRGIDNQPISGKTSVWDRALGRVLHVSKTASSEQAGDNSAAAHIAEWGNDGRLATACGDKSIRIWRMGEERPQFVLGGYKKPIHQLAWNQASSVIATPGDQGEFVFWDASTGNKLLVSEDDSNLQDRNYKGAQVRTLAWAPDGKQIASAGHGQAVRIWNVKIEKTSVHLEIAPSLEHAPVGPTSDIAPVSPLDFRTVDNQESTILSWSPNGRWLLVTNSASRSRRNNIPIPELGRMTVWNVERQEKVEWQGKKSPLGAFDWSPVGNRLATCQRIGIAIENGISKGYRPAHVVVVWELESGESTAMTTTHNGKITSLSFNHDGTRIASGSTDRSIKIWDVERAQEVFTIRRFNDCLSDVCFSPDGNHLAASCIDGSSKIFDGTQTAQMFLNNDGK